MRKHFLFAIFLSVLSGSFLTKAEVNEQKKPSCILSEGDLASQSFDVLAKSNLAEKDYAIKKYIKKIVWISRGFWGLIHDIVEEIRENVIEYTTNEGELARALNKAAALNPDTYSEQERRQITKELITSLLNRGANLNDLSKCDRCFKRLRLYPTVFHYLVDEIKPPHSDDLVDKKNSLYYPLRDSKIHGLNDPGDERQISPNAEILVDELVKHGADINVLDNNGNTPLHHDMQDYNDYVGGGAWTGIFIKHGANPNAQDKDGNTALMLALKYKHAKNAIFLIDSGSNPRIKNNGGNTALH